LNEVLKQIEQRKRFVLPHARPDGDAVGSTLAAEICAPWTKTPSYLHDGFPASTSRCLANTVVKADGERKLTMLPSSWNVTASSAPGCKGWSSSFSSTLIITWWATVCSHQLD